MQSPIYRFGEFELDPASRELRRHDEPVSLPPKSFECLVYLIQHRDRAVGRDELISAVWGRVDASDALVAQTLLRARRAVGDTAGSEQATIRTVPRFGYRWVAAVAEVEAGTAVATPDDAVPIATAAETDPTTLAEPGAAQAMPHAAGVASEPGPMATDGIAPVPGVAPATRSRRRPTLWILGLVVVAIGAALSWRFWPSTGEKPPANARQASELAIVMPVAVAADGAEHSWIRLGAMDYIASRLRGQGHMLVLPSEQVLRLARDENGGDRQLARLRATTGARWLIAPEVSQDGRGWRVRLQLHDGNDHNTLEAHGDSPLAAAAAVSDALLRRLGRMPAGAATLPTPTAFTERIQQVDAELLAGQLAAARGLIHSAPEAQRNAPQLRVREGQLEFRAGNVDAAAALFNRLMARTGTLPVDVAAKTLMGLGAVAIRRGDFVEAEQRYTQALQVLESDTVRDFDPTLPGNAYNGRGVARAELGRTDEGIADIGRARIAMQRAGDAVEAASVGNNIGLLEARRGQHARALQEFDRAIATFERFDVSDHLAAALQAKARSQLSLLQPRAALVDSSRAARLGTDIENPHLQDSIDLTHAEVLLANGRLRDAEALLQAFQQREHPRPSASLPALQLRSQLERGRGAEALSLAQRLLATDEPPTDTMVLLAVQAALGNGALAQARAWLQRLPPAAAGEASLDRFLAQALVAAAADDQSVAERAFTAARSIAAGRKVPEEELRAGCAQIAYLIAQGKLDRASAVMGELSSFVDRDYRAARTALVLYRALGDRALQATALAQVRTLAGERDPALPLLY